MKTTDALKQIVDTTLEVIKDKVDDEATARTNADTTLDNKINKLNSNDNLYWMWRIIEQWVWVGHQGTFSVNRQYIWDDGTDVYYSNGSTYQLRLKSETEWEDTTWNGVSSFYGSGVWKDLNGNIYLNSGSDNFKLNKETKTWESISLTNTPSINNMYIWDDGEYVYYSNGNTQKRFSDNTWTNVSWSGIINLNGNNVWKDTKGNIYYSNGATQLQWNKSTLTWTQVSWGTYFEGNKIWSDDNYTYLSNSAYLGEYKFNFYNWYNMNWLVDYGNSLSTIGRNTIWKDFNNNIYYSPNGSSTYITTPTILRDYLVYHAGRIDNPHKVTKAQVGLENVTNDAQIKGNASGTVENNISTWGNDGYSLKDSGKSFTTTIRDSANASDDKIPTEKAVRTELDTKVDKTTLGVISLSTSSGTLTLEQYAEISKDYGIIKYDGKTFYKVKLIQGEGGSNDILVFLSSPENVDNTTYTSINLESIIVDTTTLAYAYSSDSIVDVYDTTQANNLFSTKANTVTNVTYDTTNDKFTLTINGTTTDIVSISTLKADIDAINDRYVRYDTNSQGLNSTQKSNAKTNLDLNNVTNDKQVKAIQSSTDKDIVVFNGTDGATIKDSGTKISDLQPKLDTQTAYTNKGSATKVPQITTNSLGQVTNITEVTLDQPAVNDGTLTIQQDGITVGTFSANQSSNETVNIVSPTVNNPTISIERNQGKDTVTDTFTLNQSTNKTLNVNDLGARCNLGSFDSVSGNVITRQTGYVDLGSLNWILIEGSDYWFWRVEYSGNQEFIDNSTISNCKHSTYQASSINSMGYTNNTISIANTYMLCRTTSTSERPSGFLQYKLATPYTETIIENQPLNTLDQKGSEWLRNEWEKTLNIWDEQWESGTYNTNGEKTSYGGKIRNVDFIEVKPNTTYYIYCGNADGLNIWEYNSSKVSVDFSEIYNNNTITTTSNTKYINFSTFGTGFSSYNNNFMIVEGTHAYPYQAYNGAIVHEKDITPVLLWENASPNSAFADNSSNPIQIATLQSYKNIELHYIHYCSSSTFGEKIAKFKVSSYGEYFFESASNYRKIIINNTNVTFDGGNDTNNCIPVAIYGLNY